MAKSTQPPDLMSVGLHMSAGYGYEVFPDGSIQLCPMLADQMAAFGDQQRGIDALLESTNRFAIAALTQIESQRRLWWKRVAADFGGAIDLSDSWTISSEGRLRRIEPEAKA